MKPKPWTRSTGDFRLKSARAVDGFIPGEGAVLLLLETAAKAAARKAEPLGVLSEFGFGREIRNYASDLMSSGDGLRQALQPALARPPKPGSAGRWVLCDLNGESYRACGMGHSPHPARGTDASRDRTDPSRGLPGGFGRGEHGDADCLCAACVRARIRSRPRSADLERVRRWGAERPDGSDFRGKPLICQSSNT